MNQTLKKLLVASAALIMTASSGARLANNANAHRRYYRTHRVYRHRTRHKPRRKAAKITPHWYHGHYYKYRTGYFYGGQGWVPFVNGYFNRKWQFVYTHKNGKDWKNLGPDWYEDEGTIWGPYGYTRVIQKASHKSKHHFNKTNKIHKAHKLSRSTIINQMKAQTLQDINQDRENNGLSDLTETSGLMNIANMRAAQSVDIHGLNHYDSNHNMMEVDDANQIGADIGNTYGENLAEADLGDTSMDGDPHQFDNKNGKDMANEDEDSMLNYDATSSWMHRQNILDSNYSSIGIGVKYDGTDETYYLAEDFGNPSDNSSNNDSNSNNSSNSSSVATAGNGGNGGSATGGAVAVGGSGGSASANGVTVHGGSGGNAISTAGGAAAAGGAGGSAVAVAN